MVLLLSFSTIAAAEAAYDDQENPSDIIRLEDNSAENIFAFFQHGTIMDVDGEPKLLYSHEDVKTFYELNGYRSAWRDRRHIISLLNLITDSRHLGLKPSNSDYSYSSIRHLLSTVEENDGEFDEMGSRAKLDILLTDAFMALGYHLNFGMTHMLDISEHHAVDRRELDIVAVLQHALESGEIEENLLALEPEHDGYRKLKEALYHYIAMEESGGWEMLKGPADGSDKERFRFNESLQERLEITGDYNYNGSLPHLKYEERLKEAVIRFQERNNLAPDGVVGRHTLSVLNSSVDEVIEKLILNMERWKWLPAHMEPEYVVVNIPDYKLRVVEGNTTALEMKVIIGKHQRKTPTFDAEMSNLVFNPYWRVPETILKEDLLPKVKQDFGYLKEKEIKIFNANDRHEYTSINPEHIDWDEMDEESITHYKFRQEPGAKNPLGYVKFIFPNRFNVYIHDTPAKEKFNFEKTMFSSGCIRVRKPIELAAYLLKRDHPETTYKDIFDRILSGKVKGIWFKNRLHVYITYQTAWVDGANTLHIRDDIYDFDDDLAAMLRDKL